MANLSNNDLIVAYVRGNVGGIKRLITQGYIQSQEELLNLQPQSDQVFIRYHLLHAPKEELPKYLSMLNKLGSTSQLLKVTGNTEVINEENLIRGLINIPKLDEDADTLLNLVGEPNHSFFIAEVKWVYSDEQMRDEIDTVRIQTDYKMAISTDSKQT